MAFMLIIISVCSSLAEGLIIKKYNSRHANGGFIFTALVFLFAMIFFLLTERDGYNFPKAMVPYAVLSGILYSTASVLTFEALACGSYVMSMLLLSYSLVFSIVYGLVYLHEPASIYTYLGLGLIIVSLYLTRGKKDTHGIFCSGTIYHWGDKGQKKCDSHYKRRNVICQCDRGEVIIVKAWTDIL